LTTLEAGRQELRQYVSEQGNAGNRRSVKLVEIWIDNPKLKDGLVLIDTPGVGSLNIEHTAVTYAIIPYVDAVLFVGAADQPLTVPELGFAQKINDYTPHLMYVLTKRDRAQNWEERLRDDLAKLEQQSQSRPGGIPAVAVSNYIKIESLKDMDEALAEMSGFPLLERAMWGLLQQRASILLGQAQSRALSVIAQLRLPLKTEKAALETTSIPELKKIEDDLREKIERAEELSSESALWLNQLASEMQELQAVCGKALADQFQQIQQAVADYLRIPEYVNSPRKLAAMLTVDCNNTVAKMISNIDRRVRHIVTRLRAVTSLQLEDADTSFSGYTTIEISGQFERKNESLLKKTSDIGRSSTIHTMGVGAASAFIGGLIGGIIGTFAAPGAGTLAGAAAGAKLAGTAGALVGGVFGIQRGFSEMEERDSAWLKQNLATESAKQLDRAHRTIAHELTLMLNSVRNNIYQDMIRRIQEEQKACRKARASLEQKKYESQSEKTQRIRTVTNALKMLDTLEATVRDLKAVSGSGSMAAD
jgi:hypothetical protein